MNRQNEMNAELIAQLVVAGVERPKVARSLDMTYPTLDRIMSTPEYQAIEDRVAGRTKKKMEELADERLKTRLGLKVEVEDAVAAAIDVLLRKLRKNDKDQLRAALEILDRDPLHQFTKASRQADSRDNAPQLSDEAFAEAVKEAAITRKIVEEASKKLQ